MNKLKIISIILLLTISNICFGANFGQNNVNSNIIIKGQKISKDPNITKIYIDKNGSVITEFKNGTKIISNKKKNIRYKK